MSACFYYDHIPGLENTTRPLIFTSASGCRASENLDISSINYKISICANIFCDAGQVPILRYFEACILPFIAGYVRGEFIGLNFHVSLDSNLMLCI